MRGSRIVPRPNDAPPDDASLYDVERWLRARRVESGYGFDPTTGKKVWERHTEGMEIALSSEDLAHLVGMIFTHNHPQGWLFPASDPRRLGTSFSPEDIHVAALARVAEIRAISPGYTFTMRAGGSGWPAPDQVRPMFDLVKQGHVRQTTDAMRAGTIDPRAVIRDAPHAVWSELAPAMNLEYRRIPINDR